MNQSKKTGDGRFFYGYRYSMQNLIQWTSHYVIDKIESWYNKDAKNYI